MQIALQTTWVLRQPRKQTRGGQPPTRRAFEGTLRRSVSQEQGEPPKSCDKGESGQAARHRDELAWGNRARKILGKIHSVMSHGDAISEPQLVKREVSRVFLGVPRKVTSRVP